MEGAPAVRLPRTNPSRLTSPVLHTGDLKRADGAGAEPGTAVWCVCHQPGHCPGQALCLAKLLAGWDRVFRGSCICGVAVGQLRVCALKQLLGCGLPELDYLRHCDADECVTGCVTRRCHCAAGATGNGAAFK